MLIGDLWSTRKEESWRGTVAVGSMAADSGWWVSRKVSVLLLDQYRETRFSVLKDKVQLSWIEGKVTEVTNLP
jgi:hypothetical protein